MTLAKISSPLRAFLFTSSMVTSLGIWLTGFEQTHWLLYISAIAFFIAGVTGICPGMMVSNKLFSKAKADQAS